MKMNQNVVLVGNLGSLLTVFKSFIIKGRVIVFDNFDINVKLCLEKARMVLSLWKNAPISGLTV